MQCPVRVDQRLATDGHEVGTGRRAQKFAKR